MASAMTDKLRAMDARATTSAPVGLLAENFPPASAAVVDNVKSTDAHWD